MHAFFLGPNCKALEHVHFLPADGDQSSSMAVVDIKWEKDARDNAKGWDESHTLRSVVAFKIADPDDFTPAKNSEAPQGMATLPRMMVILIPGFPPAKITWTETLARRQMSINSLLHLRKQNELRVKADSSISITATCPNSHLQKKVKCHTVACWSDGFTPANLFLQFETDSETMV